LVHVQEVNYPSTYIRRRYGTYPVYDTWLHTNTITWYKTKYKIQAG